MTEEEFAALCKETHMRWHTFSFYCISITFISLIKVDLLRTMNLMKPLFSKLRHVETQQKHASD